MADSEHGDRSRRRGPSKEEQQALILAQRTRVEAESRRREAEEAAARGTTVAELRNQRWKEMQAQRKEMEAKIRENLLRRVAARQGFTLRKSRRRDPLALDYGAYWLVQIVGRHKEHIVLGGEWGTDLDSIEAYLMGGGDQ